MTILAFNNDPALADRIRAQVLTHEAADEIVQGTYWENGKGCFIGCIAHSSSAEDAAGLLGGDVMLVKIAESIFEGLPNDQAKHFPGRVLLAPRVGANLSLVPWQFLHWCVTDALTHADDKTRNTCDAAVAVLAAKAAGEPVSQDAARAAADAARAAAYAARAAAYARAKQADKLVELLGDAQ